MKKPDIPSNEHDRLNALYKYSILDTLPEKDFDDMTKLAAQICGTPISTVTFIDSDRQWFKSNHGLNSKGSERDYAFCAHAINNPDQILEVPDSRLDDRFADNPLVTGDPHVVYYAGVPLVDMEGYALGTLCIIDNKPNKLNEEQRDALKAISSQVVQLLELRKKNIELDEKKEVLERALSFFAETSKIATVGGWEFDLTKNKLIWTFITKEIHEVEADFEPDFQTAINFYKEGESRDKIKRLITAAIENNTPFDEEMEIVTAKRNEKWVRAKGQSVFEDGVCKRVYGIIQDIHEQKLKDIELKLSEERFSQTFNYATTGLALLTPDLKWIKVNKSFSEIVGYSEDELKQMSLYDITHPDDLAEDLELMKQLSEEKIESYEFEKRYIHKDGHIVWGILSRSVVRDRQNKPLHFVTNVVDITNRKEAEQIIEEERKLLATLIDNIPVNIFIKDVDSRKILVNRQEMEYMGVANEIEIIGKNDFELYPLESAIISVEEDKQVISTGESIINKETYNKKFDDSEHYFLTSKIPLLNSHNQVTGLLGISYDITDRKINEKKMKDLLEVTSEQNIRLSNFAHIVSHNLRSHATNFSLLIELFETEREEAEKHNVFELFKSASERLTQTVLELEEVVSVSTNIKKEMQPINLHNALEKVQENIKGQMLRENVQCINQVDQSFYVNAAPAYLDSILLNFFTNAIKYRSHNRVPYIKLTAERKNGFIILNIEDNGLGIDLQKNADKLFGMYKTFHGNKDARGVGLFITKNQIESMGGKVEVESEVNVGTTFRIYFTEKD